MSVTTRSVSASTTIPAFYRILLRSQFSRGRAIGAVALGLIAVVTAVIARGATDPEQGAIFAVGFYGLSLMVPLITLMLASPLLGNLVEDRLLVYLWLKPTPRWHLAAAAWLATASVLIPATVVPLVVAALVSGQTGLLAPAALAGVLGVLAYGGFFLWLGLRFRFGVWLGLAYIVVWENAVAAFGDGPARFAIRSYLLTIVQWGTDRTVELANRSDVASIVVPLLFATIGVALTARALTNRDID